MNPYNHPRGCSELLTDVITDKYNTIIKSLIIIILYCQLEVCDYYNNNMIIKKLNIIIYITTIIHNLLRSQEEGEGVGDGLGDGQGIVNTVDDN